MKTRIFAAFALLISSLTALAGCSQQTLQSAQNDANHNITVASEKAKQAERDARPQIDKVSLQSRVTAALVAANLPTSIHVRADTNGVYLRGNVKTAGDKTRAGQIARDTLGPGKAVHNEIRVSGQ